MAQWYDKQAKLIGDDVAMLLKYGAAGDISDYARVALDDVDGAMVSTVWLGLDHNFGDGPPLIFETMIFNHPLYHDECRRYSTEQEAQDGHQEAVANLQEGNPPW